jgi:threonine synthase
VHFEPRCDDCGDAATAIAMRCSRCGGTLSFGYDLDRVQWDERRRGVLRYWRLLPVADPAAAVSLGEGSTPLVGAGGNGRPAVHYKVETGNPTGSHKDRQLCVAMAHAVQLGKGVSALVSSGSTGLSNAAYAARAGLRSIVCMAAGVPRERIYPVYALGSHVVEVDGAVDELIDHMAGLTAETGVYHSSTARICNPYQAEGAKTIAYEIAEDLGRVPDWVVVPVGGGGTIAAIGRGFFELCEAGHTDRVPRLVGAVSARFNALERAYGKTLSTQQELRDLPDTGGPVTPVQAKLAHVVPPDGADALAAVRGTDGLFVPVSDDEALAAQAELGAGEGIYVEPSSGTAVAALQRLLADGDVAGSDTVVVVLCGSGFRETGLAMEYRPLQTSVLTVAELRTLFERAATRAGGRP